MAGWAPLPTGEGATPLLKMLRAIDAQISGTVVANAGTLVDLNITGALTIDVGGSFSATDSSGRFVAIDSVFSNWAGVEFGDTGEAGTYSVNAALRYVTGGILNMTAPEGTGIHSGQTQLQLKGGADPNAFIQAISNNALTGTPSVTFTAWDIPDGDLTSLSLYPTYIIFNESGGPHQLRLAMNGTAAAPTLGWIDSSTNYDSGFYRPAVDQIGVAIGGQKYVTFKLPGENQGATSSSDGVLFVDTLPFELDSNTGAIIAGQSWRWDVGSNLVHLEMQAVRDSTGTDWTTAAVGIRRLTDTTSQASLWWKGSQIIVNATGSNYGNTLAVSGTIEAKPATTGSAANAAYVGGTGGWWELRHNTSARKYKRRISYDWQDYLAGMELMPAYFYRPDDDKMYFDFIAEDLAEQDGIFGVYTDEGEIDNYHKPAVLAILAAKVNALEARVKELENGVH